MGRWYGTTVGFRVKRGDRAEAEHLLRCLGADPDGEPMFEPIGVLDRRAYRPTVEGAETGYGDVTWLLNMIRQRAEAYVIECRFPGDDGEEEAPECEGGAGDEPVFMPDGLFWLVNRIIPGTGVYLAHEEGSSVMDDFYRYEASLDAASGKKTELDCYYCYGDGINTGTGNPKKEGLRRTSGKIDAKAPDPRILERLIAEAEKYKYAELAEKLRACRQPDGA